MIPAGFTGQHIARELGTVVATEPTCTDVTFGLAGRNKEKLQQVAADIGFPSIPIIIADVNDSESMMAMAKSCRLVLSAAGPFRYLGEQVVAACVENGTDYLDICGEPEFIERIELNYNDRAQKSGCYVSSAVGFDSIPGDVGALYASQQFVPPALCTQVETFITFKPGEKGLGGHYATFKSAVEGFGSVSQLKAIRREAKTKIHAGQNRLSVPGPAPLKHGRLPTYDSRLGKWIVPFVGSDASVMRRTALSLQHRGKPAYRVAVYLTLPSVMAAVEYSIFGAVFAFMAQYQWGRSLLLKYPRVFSLGIFSHEGPSDEQIAQTSFEVLHICKGYSQRSAIEDRQPDQTIKVKVAGPEPGYAACPIFAAAATITLLKERNKLKLKPGVHTPAILFQNTSYIDRLRSRGITFQVSDND